MKKIIITVLLGGFALQQPAWSQTNPTDTNPPPAMDTATNAAPAAEPVTNPPVAEAPAMTTPAAPAVESNAPAVSATGADAAAAPAVVTTNAPGATTNEAALAAAATNAPSMATTNEMAAASSGTNATEAAAGATTNAASIPLIVFQDAPLTTAIESLARQAGINYLLDPKIGYGQPDQNGQIKPEPTLSIRWENITAEQALVALLDNYGLELQPDKKTHIARITIKNPNAPPPLITRVVQLKYSSVSNITEAVQSVFTDKRSKVLADVRTSQLVVVATDPEQSAVDTLIAQLDKPTRQVLIETHFVEISSNPSSSKGIDWSGTLSAQNISFGNGVVQPASTSFQSPGVPVTTTFGGHTITTTPGYTQTTTVGGGGTSGSTSASSSSSGGSTIGGGLIPNGFSMNTMSGLMPDIGFLNADGLHAVLSFLNSSSDAQIVSTPRVVTLDNQLAKISVTRGFPVINVTAGTANTTGGSSIAYTNVGTILEVTPRITANDYIWMKVVPDVSSFFGKDSETVAGQLFQADIFDFRHIETQVIVPNGNTLVMGGLVNDNPQTSTTKVPVLGDIPILGYAFRSENKTLAKDNLMIFITPTIVKDTDFQPATTDFLQSSPNAALPQLMNPDSPWDSTKPDWSNLFHKQQAAAGTETSGQQ